MRRYLLLVLTATLSLAGCGNIQSREIVPKEYEIDATGRYANDHALSLEAEKICPRGYNKVAETKERLATAEIGPWWRWRIVCSST